MKKFSILMFILFVLILSGCSASASGLSDNIREDGETAVNILYSANQKGEKITSAEDNETLKEFFDKYGYSEEGDNDTKDEQFAYDVAYLEIVNANYLEAYEDNDIEKMEEKKETFNSILKKIELDYEIKVSD
jgi:hypothetical protein